MDLENLNKKNNETLTTAHKQCGFQCNLQVQFPLARFLSGDRVVNTQSRTAHSRDRYGQTY